MKKAIEIYQKVQDELKKYMSGFMHSFSEKKSVLQVLFIANDLKYPQNKVENLCELIGISIEDTSSEYKITKHYNPKNELRWVITFNFKELIVKKNKKEKLEK